MATLSHSESKRHYSWWWNSHISPKNSKWLQENLTDMDLKVKAMIKLIEEDADSFARRAEMYYKKRPELMKMVEEFYRAYRALAERYDNATGALRQAHRTMAEAFPNQIPLVLSDESPHGSSSSEVEPHTPEMTPPVRALFDPDELQKDALGFSSDIHVIKRNGAYSEINSLSSKKGLKQLTEMSATEEGAARLTLSERRTRKGLNFQEEEEEGFDTKSHKGSRELQHVKLKQDRSNIVENLQQDNARLLTENQNLKSQVMEESDRAKKDEIEVEMLKDAFSKLKCEKDTDHLQYLERILALESQLSNTQNDLKKLNDEMVNEVQKLNSAEKLNQSLKLEFDMLEERTKMQEGEIQSLKDVLSKLKSEKDADHLQYQISLERISTLEFELSNAQNDLKKLNDEMANEVQKLNSAEKLNQSLQLELDKIEKRAKIQEDEIKQKSSELDKLHVALQDRHQKCVQAEVVLLCKEKLLVQSHEEIYKLKEKNNILIEENLDSTSTIKYLQDEIVLLKDQKNKLEDDVGVCLREKEFLNQELFQLKEDRNGLERRHQDLMEQMKAVIINSKSLQADTEDLKEKCKQHEDERMLLLEKLKHMDSISEKNVLLENSLTNANMELEVLREKLAALDDSHESLRYEKDSLISQMQILAHDMEKLSEKNTFMENSLYNANTEVEHLTVKLKEFEESCQFLNNQNSALIAERNNLVTKVELITQDLGNMTRGFAELQNQHSSLSRERDLLTSQVKEFQDLLELEKQEHLHSTSMIKDLQDEMILLKDQKTKLKGEVGLFIREKEILNQELFQLKEDRNHLERRQNDLMEQLKAVNITSESLEVDIKDLKEKCKEHEAEKMLLQEKLKYVGNISEKNVFLESSLRDASVELDVLKEKLASLDDSHESLNREKDSLVSQVQIFTLEMEKLSEKNTFMKNSLSDVNNEVAHLSVKLKDFEESHQLLNDQNSALIAEKVNLTAQLEKLTLDVEKITSGFSELQDQHSSLSREWGLSTNQVKELQDLLKQEKQEHLYSTSIIKDLQGEKISLKDQKRKLEDQVGMCAREKGILHQELLQLKEEKNHLEKRQQDLMEQLKAVNITSESLEADIKNLKEKCQEQEAEKMLLREKLNYMDNISEKNEVLENSLRDADVELEVLKEKLASLDDSHESLNREKDSLVSQVQILTFDMEKLSEKNTSMEKSLSDVNSEVECLSGKLKDFEDSCQLLNNQNSALSAERNNLVAQVQSMTLDLENIANRFAELQDQHSSLSREWNQSTNQVKELKGLLELEKKEHLHSISIIEDLQDEIILLKGQKSKLEDEIERHVREKENINQELFQLKEDKNDLARRHQYLMDQMKAVSLTSESLEAAIIELKENCKEHEAEKELLLEKLKFMDNISEKNVGLENSLTDANAESKILREKLAALDDSHQSLNCEKDLLVSQVQILNDDVEKLSEKNTFLENSLSDVNSEVEHLSTKLKGFEDSCQFLNDQNSALIAEKSSLVSQVVKITLNLEDITSRFAELQDQHSSLSREWDLSTNQVKNMQSLLELEKQEHQAIIKSCKAQLTTLENHISLLQKQNQFKEKELEAEQSNLYGAMVETFVLRATLCNVQERNLILSLESQKHLEAYSSSKALFSQLEQEKLIHLGNIMSLTECKQNLSNKIRQLSSIIVTDQDLEYLDEIQDEVLLDIIFVKVKTMLTCASEAEFDFQELHLEISVFATLMRQFAIDMVNVRLEKISLQQELEIKTEHILSLQGKQLEFLELNEKLMKIADASKQREEALKSEAEVLCMQLNDLQESLQMSKSEILKLLEENKTLSEELRNLKQKHNELEEQHVDVLAEAMKLDHLHLLFKSVSAERLLELKSFSHDLNSVCSTRDDLRNEVNRLNDKISLLEAEKMLLMRSVTCLQEEFRICLLNLEFHLNTASIVFEDLDFELQHTKNQLTQKNMQLSEANWKILSTEGKNIELHRLLESLYMENEEEKLVKEEMRKRILNLSGLVAQRNEMISKLHEANDMLQKETDKMQKDVEFLMTKEKHLVSELVKEMEELANCEFEFVALLDEHHISTVHAAICEEKLNELIVERETLSLLEKQFLRMEVDLTKNYTNELKKKLGDLVEENRGVKADMDAYLPLVKSLCNCIASLEAQIMSMPNVKPLNTHEKEDISSGSYQHDHVSQPFERHKGTKNAGVLELEELIARVKSLQEVLINTQNLLERERFDSTSCLGAAMKEIDDLNKEALALQAKQANKKSSTEMDNDEGISDAVISKGKYGQAMKDIQLDQVSSSLPDRDESSFELPKNGSSEIDDQLWEAAETESKHHRRKASSVLIEHDIEAVEEEKSEYPSSELVAEKELGVDKLEISSRDLASERTWNGKVVQRLESDARRLSDLKKSIDELKSKMDNSQMRRLPASFGYDTIKSQINEAEAAVLELIDSNINLAKKTEEYTSMNVADVESKERRSTGRMQVSEQAKKLSEKVGRLELEVQKFHYVLLKLEEELENRRIKSAERKTRVLLRDYLYGRKGNLMEMKKMRCCGCIRPQTSGD